MYISPKPSFEPKRGNSKETTQIGGQPVTWYSSEIAGSETLVARETLLPLRDGRTAHIWVQAPSQEALNATLGETQNLRFGPASADTQVAGQ
ncbi:hypothetical protein [Montanilutibacter psychrotolerans]|uniref:Uncharacterized protein n=1 Tax=Montanilutibacter psychrotolerans TaxID=1327343 RepID=A0A3M8SSB4_9GAMM|nr:hypothetical protein [Lysobacter psychrotolerans]RNF81720.1 hypothetical protein EER27_16525 [Lysobacter psychrotolerans]